MLLRRALLPSVFVVAAMVLAGCTQPPAPAAHQVVRSANDLVAAIHAAGKHDQSVIRIKPLHQPGVTDLLDKAQHEKARQHYKTAAATLDKALKLAPKAPDILQDRAQLAVRLGDYAQAEKLARRSFKLGPKVGALCARNWQTVLEMRRIAKDPAGVQAARTALAKCNESGPVRM